MKKCYIVGLVCGMVMFGITGIASAIPINYTFSGTLNSITDNYSILNDQFSVGNIFAGSFTYETETPEGITTLDDPTIAIYSAVTSFEVDINGYVIKRDSIANGHLQVRDNYIIGNNIVDAFSVDSGLDYSPPISGMGEGTVLASANLNFIDWTHTALMNGINISSLIDLSDYSSNTFRAIQMNMDNQQSIHLGGTITSLQFAVPPTIPPMQTPIPEPATILLFGTGLAGLAAVSRRKKA